MSLVIKVNRDLDASTIPRPSMTRPYLEKMLKYHIQAGALHQPSCRLPHPSQ